MNVVDTVGPESRREVRRGSARGDMGRRALMHVARHLRAPALAPAWFRRPRPHAAAARADRGRARARRITNRARWPPAVLRLQTDKPSEIRNFLAEALAYPVVGARRHRVRHACVVARGHIGIFIRRVADILVLPRRGGRRAPAASALASARPICSARGARTSSASRTACAAARSRADGALDELEPMLECYPVVRLCDVPSHGSERAVETFSEHADHLATVGRRPFAARRQRVGGDAAAEGGARRNRAACSVDALCAAARDGDEDESAV